MIDKIDSFEILMLIKGIYFKSMGKIESKLSDSGLTHQQIMIIKILAHNKEINISQLCKELSLSKGTVSGIVNRLEQAEYIEKVKYESDKRNTYIKLSSKGLEFAFKFKKQMNEAFNNLFSSLNKEEYNAAINGLKILENKINE